MNQVILSGQVLKVTGTNQQRYSYNFNMKVIRPAKRPQDAYDKDNDMFLVNAYDSAAMCLKEEELKPGDEIVIKGWMKVVAKEGNDGKTNFSTFLVVDDYQDIISIVKGKFFKGSCGNCTDEEVIFEGINDARR